MNNDNSETVYVLQKVKEDPNYFYFISKHPSVPILLCKIKKIE